MEVLAFNCFLYMVVSRNDNFSRQVLNMYENKRIEELIDKLFFKKDK